MSGWWNHAGQCKSIHVHISFCSRRSIISFLTHGSVQRSDNEQTIDGRNDLFRQVADDYGLAKSELDGLYAPDC